MWCTTPVIPLSFPKIGLGGFVTLPAKEREVEARASGKNGIEDFFCLFFPSHNIAICGIMLAAAPAIL